MKTLISYLIDECKTQKIEKKLLLGIEDDYAYIIFIRNLTILIEVHIYIKSENIYVWALPNEIVNFYTRFRSKRLYRATIEAYVEQNMEKYLNLLILFKNE